MGGKLVLSETITDREAPDWGTPKVTDNARLLSGYIVGALSQRDLYELVGFDSTLGTIVVRSHLTGNRFKVTVAQVAGSE
jgi:hypothetical protein